MRLMIANWALRFRLFRAVGHGRIASIFVASSITQKAHRKAWDKAIKEVLGE